MKKIATVDAAGTVLCHDLTRIVKGAGKDAAFRRGHVVAAEDIPHLLSMGKEHLFVWDLGDDMLHEDDAAAILLDICRGERMAASRVKEGKIELRAETDGLFVADTRRLDALNRLGEISVAARHSGFPVVKGDKLAGFRVIPLAVSREKMARATALAGASPLFRLLPFKPMRAGVVATGGEVFHKRIPDTFTPVVADKLAQFGSTVAAHVVCDDDMDGIAAAVRKFLDDGLDLVVCTGGMSVDPDDRTPGAIKAAGAEVVCYGTPALPGAMFLVAYKGDVPVVGLPGCVMYEKKTVFDIVLPRIAAGRRVTRDELAGIGNGGLCLGCPACIFPACGFGKGYSYA